MFEETKEFVGKKENIPSILSFIQTFATQHHFPDSFVNKILMVGDELFSNIINHGYQNEGGPIIVDLSFEESNNEFTLKITDEAKEFNQLSVSSETAGKGLQIGGLGIFIVKQIMSECLYEWEDERNILTLKKRF